MSLVASFKHPVADAQFSFRRILKALSEPGSIVALPEMSGFGVLDSASACVLLTLIDQDTPLWISPRLNDDVLRQNLRFHTGAVLTEDPSSVSFALAEGSLDSATLLAFPCGDEMSPELATSVIVQVESLEGGKPLRLLGRGLNSHALSRCSCPTPSPNIYSIVHTASRWGWTLCLPAVSSCLPCRARPAWRPANVRCR